MNFVDMSEIQEERLPEIEDSNEAIPARFQDSIVTSITLKLRNGHSHQGECEKLCNWIMKNRSEDIHTLNRGEDSSCAALQLRPSDVPPLILFKEKEFCIMANVYDETGLAWLRQLAIDCDFETGETFPPTSTCPTTGSRTNVTTTAAHSKEGCYGAQMWDKSARKRPCEIIKLLAELKRKICTSFCCVGSDDDDVYEKCQTTMDQKRDIDCVERVFTPKQQEASFSLTEFHAGEKTSNECEQEKPRPNHEFPHWKTPFGIADPEVIQNQSKGYPHLAVDRKIIPDPKVIQWGIQDDYKYPVVSLISTLPDRKIPTDHSKVLPVGKSSIDHVLPKWNIAVDHDVLERKPLQPASHELPEKRTPADPKMSPDVPEWKSRQPTDHELPERQIPTDHSKVSTTEKSSTGDDMLARRSSALDYDLPLRKPLQPVINHEFPEGRTLTIETPTDHPKVTTDAHDEKLLQPNRVQTNHALLQLKTAADHGVLQKKPLQPANHELPVNRTPKDDPKMLADTPEIISQQSAYHELVQTEAFPDHEEPQESDSRFQCTKAAQDISLFYLGLLIELIANRLLFQDVTKLKTWASRQLGTSVSISQMDQFQILEELRRRSVISPGNLQAMKKFFEEILRFDIVHLIDCYLAKEYSLIDRELTKEQHCSPANFPPNPASQQQNTVNNSPNKDASFDANAKPVLSGSHSSSDSTPTGKPPTVNSQVVSVTHLPGAAADQNGGGVSTHSASKVSQWLCTHYKRHCYVKFDCCDEYYPCHRCHNDARKCGKKKLRSHDTTFVKCSRCSTEQKFNEKSQFCNKCHLKFSVYFCAQCKHLTGMDDQPYHCDKCGICRIHGENSFHCDVCGVCFDKKLKNNHICRVESAHDECCICLEDAFTGCQILPCSHKIHRECATVLIRRGITTCPICRASFAHYLVKRTSTSTNTTN